MLVLINKTKKIQPVYAVNVVNVSEELYASNGKVRPATSS